MSQLKLEELKQDLIELAKLSKLAERQRIKNICLIESRKLETEIATIQDSLKSQPVESVPKKTVTTTQNRCYDIKLTNYAWDQSEKFVKLFVTVPNVHTIPEENVHCDFTATSVDMNIKALENRNYAFTLKNFLENIDIASSKWKVKKDMVVIFLSKCNTNNWSHLTSLEKKAKEPKPKLPEMDADEDPTGRLMDMMKQMYDEGDDDMKRTIAKSWTESNKQSRGGW